MFSLPLEGGGYGVCLAARVSRCEPFETAFGYFFPFRFQEIEPFIGDFQPSTDVRYFCKLVSPYMGVQSGRWKNLGLLNGFCRKNWPMPTLGFVDPANREHCYLRTYSEESPGELLFQEQADCEAVKQHFPDGILGAKAAELFLTIFARTQSISGLELCWTASTPGKGLASIM